MPLADFNSALASDVTQAPCARAACGGPLFILNNNLEEENHTGAEFFSPWALTTGNAAYGDRTNHTNIRPVIVPEEYAWLNLYAISRSNLEFGDAPKIMVLGLLPHPSGAKADRSYPRDDDTGFPALPNDDVWVPLTPGYVNAVQDAADPECLMTVDPDPVIEFGQHNDLQISDLLARVYLQGVKKIILVIDTATTITDLSTSTSTDAGSHAMIAGTFSG